MSYYAGLIKQTFKESQAYRLNFLLSFLVELIPLIGTLFFVRFIYSTGFSLTNWDYENIVLYFIVARLSSDMFTPVVWYDIKEDIKQGNLNNHLIKPYSYYFHNYTVFYSLKPVYLMSALLVSFMTSYFFIGFVSININIADIYLYILFYAAATILSFQMTFIFSISAFLLTEISSVHSLIDLAIPVLSGVFLPLDVFPVRAALILRVLPTSYIAYYPAKVLTNPGFLSENFIMIFGVMFFWIAFFAVVIRFSWNKALTKYEGIG